MTRRKTPISHQTSHLTIRCNNKEYLFRIEKNFSDIVSWINGLPLFFNVRIHHVLIMSNHIHLLVTPTESNLGAAMCYVLTNLSKTLNYKNKRMNHIFSDRYTPTIVSDTRHLQNIIRYIYQNPVRAGMVINVFDYPYSSLSFYQGSGRAGFIIDPDELTRQTFDCGIDGRQEWIYDIDSTLPQSDLDCVRGCLSRSQYRFSKQQLHVMKQNGTTLVI